MRGEKEMCCTVTMRLEPSSSPSLCDLDGLAALSKTAGSVGGSGGTFLASPRLIVPIRVFFDLGGIGGVYGGITVGPPDAQAWSPSLECEPINSIAASVEWAVSMSRMFF